MLAVVLKGAPRASAASEGWMVPQTRDNHNRKPDGHRIGCKKDRLQKGLAAKIFYLLSDP